MSISLIDMELNQYWEQLSPDQKAALLEAIRSFQLPGTKGDAVAEPEAPYITARKELTPKMLEEMTWEQKEALISLVESFGIETGIQHISIEQYNEELDKAGSEFEKGEIVSHEEVTAMTKKWVDGK